MEERFKAYLNEKFSLISIIDVEALKAKQLEKLMAKYNEYKSCGYEDEEAYNATINRFTEIDKMVKDLEEMERQNENRRSTPKSNAYKFIMITAWLVAIIAFVTLGFVSERWDVAGAAFFVMVVGISMGDIYYRLRIYDGVKSPKSIKILLGTVILGIGSIAYICVTVIKSQTANLSWLILSGSIILYLISYMIVDKVCLKAKFIDEYIILSVIDYVLFISLYILLGVLCSLWVFGIFLIVIAVILNLLLVFLRKSN